MAWELKAGDRVVCVDDDWECIDARYRRRCTFPVRGEVYTVRGVVSLSLGVGLWLAEIDNQAMQFSDGFHECAFYVGRFRPVRTTDISSLHALLKTAPARKLVDA